jgi:hypothetical protein
VSVAAHAARIRAVPVPSDETPDRTIRFGAAPADAHALLLVRSFDIPRADPAYDRLANLSWTYDNALAALAFIEHADRTQAEQLR